MRARARRDGDVYQVTGAKAWVTHAGEADFYTLFARTGNGPRGVSCFLVPGEAEGLSRQTPEHKMGLTGSTTATLDFDDVAIETERLVGDEGAGLAIALQALDSGRLGIAGVATGLAQAALDCAVRYARERTTFGRPIIEHQGLGFLLAARPPPSTPPVRRPSRRRAGANRGVPFSRQPSIAKLAARTLSVRKSRPTPCRSSAAPATRRTSRSSA